MNTKLNHIQNWQELAQKANWSVVSLAKGCRISVRTLETYFRKYYKQKPKKWLAKQRQEQAVKLLKSGYCVKEIATQLGYKHSNHFSRDFKMHWGCRPTEKMQQAPSIVNFRVLVSSLAWISESATVKFRL